MGTHLKFLPLGIMGTRFNFLPLGTMGTHWTYCLYFHSNYSTHSLYHFEKPAIVATKSYIFIFMHVKPIKVTSGFNLRVLKKIRQVALSYRKINNKYQNADISTIEAAPGVPGVSKDGPGSTEHAT